MQRENDLERIDKCLMYETVWTSEIDYDKTVSNLQDLLDSIRKQERNNIVIEIIKMTDKNRDPETSRIIKHLTTSK